MGKVLSWIGSKNRIAKHIVPLIPKHRHYIEPFCGSMAVLFSKPVSFVETVNDSDKEIINFWMVCRDSPNELFQKLQLTPYSRELRTQYFDATIPEDPIDRAVRFFYLCNTSFGGMAYDRAWGHRVKVDSSTVRCYWRQVNQIEVIFHRLADIQLECLDFADVIQRYSNNPDNFLYIDPPYIDTREYYYQDSMTIERHRELAELVNGNKSPIMISYHHHEMLDELYPGWERVSLDAYESISVKQKAAELRGTTEVLLMNYRLVS